MLTTHMLPSRSPACPPLYPYVLSPNTDTHTLRVQAAVDPLNPLPMLQCAWLP